MPLPYYIHHNPVSASLCGVKGFKIRGADGFSVHTPVNCGHCKCWSDSFLPARQCMDVLNIHYERERSGLAPVCWRDGLSAAGLSGEYRLYGGLGSVSEITGEPEFGSDRSSAVFAGRPSSVCSFSGLAVGRWSLGLGFSLHLDFQVTCTKQRRTMFQRISMQQSVLTLLLSSYFAQLHSKIRPIYKK